MNLARSSLKVFTANAAGTVIGFLGITFFARELGPHQLGVFFLFQALLGMIGIPADFGIGGAVNKRISEGKPAEGIISTALLLKLVPLTPIIVGILLFRGPINTYLGAELAKFLALAIILQTFAGLAIEVLRGELRVGETALPSLSRQVVYVGLSATLIVLGFGTLGLIYGLLAGITVMLSWGIYKSSVKIGRPSLAHARSLFDYSKHAFISSVGGYLYNWLDIAVIGFFLTQSHVGTYEIAWRVTGVVIIFSNAIASTVFPQVSQWAADDASERIEEIITEALTPSLMFVIPAFFGTMIFSREILGLVFGQEYASAWLVLILLMGDKVFQAIQVIVGRSLQAINCPDLAARAAWISLVTNVILNVILVWQFGIIGAAVGTVAASFLNNFLHIFYLSRFISLQFPWYEVGWCLLSSIGMVLCLLVIKSWIAVRTLPTLIGLVVIGIAVYLALVLISPSIRAKARRQANNLLFS